MRSGELDHTGAIFPRRIAVDVGKPPGTIDFAAIRKQPRHPAVGGAPLCGGERLEIVALGLAALRPGRVEIDGIDGHWRISTGITPSKLLLSWRKAMNPKP